jgi:hypothetical protein
VTQVLLWLWRLFLSTGPGSLQSYATAVAIQDSGLPMASVALRSFPKAAATDLLRFVSIALRGICIHEVAIPPRSPSRPPTLSASSLSFLLLYRENPPLTTGADEITLAKMAGSKEIRIPIQRIPRSEAPIALIFIFLGLSWITVGLRMWTRRWIMRSTGWDDRVMVVALVCMSRLHPHQLRLKLTMPPVIL